MVEQFSRQGSRVVFRDIASDPGDQLAQKLAPISAHAPVFLLCDLMDISSLRSKIIEIQSRVGWIEVLVNNAANDSRHSYAELTPAAWDAALAGNLRHQFFATQAVAPAMISNKGQLLRLSSPPPVSTTVVQRI